MKTATHPGPDHFAAGEEPQYALNRELVGPHSWYGCFREEKNLLFMLVSEHHSSAVRPIPSYYTD